MHLSEGYTTGNTILNETSVAILTFEGKNAIRT